MAESIEIIAIQQCYQTLGQFAVSQLVMFLAIIISLIIVIFLVRHVSKLQGKIQGMREEFLVMATKDKKGKKIK